jgi:NADH-quinone oxidoreductase subunit L
MDSDRFTYQQVLPWVVLFLPLASAVLITLFTRRERELSATISIGAVGLSFLASLVLFFMLPEAPLESGVTWLSAGNFKIELSFLLDRLSGLMTLVVTGVAFAIHWYSWGYMREDRSLPRFFASLSLFTFSMLGIVLASNFVMMFIFWELVGVSSYLLIGFWYEKVSAADAAKKAFITNRLGDFGFLVGIILIWAIIGDRSTGTFDPLNFSSLKLKLTTSPQALGAFATAAGLLIFCGAMGKSAQFPLHVWLPDAMEGPTPVSALIHAATMVAAGVYMLCRVFFLLSVPGSHALEVVAWIGGFTALLAALMAVQQNDIKRILAYSTLSQLGYMVMAVGVHGPGPAMYHLTTHAFFKALLFLGAGSIIVALHHEQDIWKMGALRPKMPVTFWTFLIGTLALCGVPPFSGFYSKDDILAAALEHGSYGLFILGVIVAALTTFYMFRLLFVVFLCPMKDPAAEHAHESPKVMTIPLIVLAVPSVIAGFFHLEGFLGEFFGKPVHGGEEGALAYVANHLFAPFNHAPLAALLGLLAVLVGFSFAFGLYRGAVTDPLPAKLGALARWMRNRFYFDELYEELIAKTQDALATAADWFDRWIVAGLMVRGAHGTTELFGRALRLFQTGNLSTYAFLLVAGVAVLIFYVLQH